MSNPTSKLYIGKNCPCPASCVRKGDCKACIAFHHDSDEKTYCEKIHESEMKSSVWSRLGKALIWVSHALCPM